VTYVYRNKEYNISNATLKTFDGPGEILDYIKECDDPEWEDYNENDGS